MGPWRSEDGGPQRRQTVAGCLGASGRPLEVVTRTAPAATMVVGTGESLYLLRHTAGDGAVAIVERIDPVTLDPLVVSDELAGGPVWPGGVGVAEDGAVVVVFGNHAHRLDGDDLSVLASVELPRDRPYNSFVTLPDGHLVTKDFAGSRPGLVVPAAERQPCELVALDSRSLAVVAAVVMPEPSIARLSADGDEVYVVGDTSLLRVRWDGSRLVLDDAFRAVYRSLEGQTYGWDCVLTDRHAWFLDDGEGSEAYSGTLRGHGVSTAPLHLVRVGRATGGVAMVEVCGREGGLVANPPVVDSARGVAVGYDSGNGVMTGFDVETLHVRWQREQDHGSHLLLFEDTGELVTGDHADVVILDVESGEELARADAGHGIQSVLFPCPAADHGAFYVVSFMGVSRVGVR